MKNVIYYFTGTGNSLRAAIKIGQKLGNTELISMRCDPATVSAADCDVIGFVFPVYHWTLPEPAELFIKRLTINPNAYIFAVAMPSLVTGFACEKLAMLIESKGASLNYGNMVNSVANYAIVYPPFPSPKRVVPRTEHKLDMIANEITERAHKSYPRAGFIVRKRYDKVMPQYKALMPFADVPFTISEECISCGLCAKVCPCHNIELQDGKPTFLHHCTNCMACVSFCPKRAIGYELTKEIMAELATYGKNVPVVKLMGLPKKRKLYHNPYVKAADVAKARIHIE